MTSAAVKRLLKPIYSQKFFHLGENPQDLNHRSPKTSPKIGLIVEGKIPRKRLYKAIYAVLKQYPPTGFKPPSQNAKFGLTVTKKDPHIWLC